MNTSPGSAWYLLLPCCLLALTGCKSNPPAVPAQELQPPPVVQNPPLSLEKIAELSKSGTSPQIIINQINTTGSTYVLSVDQITWLRQQGVVDSVIEYMQTHAPGAVVVGGAPPPPPVYVRPVYAYPAYGYGYYGYRRGYYYGP